MARSGFSNAAAPNVPVSAQRIPQAIGHVYADAVTVLSFLPSNGSRLTLFAESGAFRIRPGDHSEKVIGTVDTVADSLEITAHDYETGEGPIRLSTDGTLPAGLNATTDYYVVVVDADHVKLATSRTNALAKTPTVVNITDAGTGNHNVGVMPAAPTASTPSHGSLLLKQDKEIIISTPDRLTVQGSVATAILTYWQS